MFAQLPCKLSVMNLVVVGLGYVGLPLAQAASKNGISVTGFDTNNSIVEALNKGKSHIDDLSDEDIQAMLSTGFRATIDETALDRADTIVICVPTPLSNDGSPDLRPVLSATNTVSRHIHRELLVVLESTTYPGTTDEEILPRLESASGLRVGTDFSLAFSPERVDPGNPTFGISNTPKVVGGVTPQCTDSAVAFYSRFVETVVPAKGAREAETAKLLENTYRNINIALVNELAQVCHALKVDVWDVIRCAKTKPFGFQAFYPGVGVGGHCIPIDPSYLSYKTRTELGHPFHLIELAQDTNSSMPLYVASRIQDALNERGKPLKGSRVLLLGVTFKPDIADQRQSPAIPLGTALLEKGAIVQYHDPFVAQWNLACETILRVPDLDDALQNSDITVLVQKHSSYNISELETITPLFFDTYGWRQPDMQKTEGPTGSYHLTL